MNFKNKQVLITAGPTWVPLDSVRVISNIATGKTGILLANQLAKLGAKVTLLLGPVEACGINRQVKTIKFKFFDELSSLLNKEIKKVRYDTVIQTAAVSDYRPVAVSRKKLSSTRKTLKLTLNQAPKIIDSLRKALPRAILVGFKFEPDLTGDKLIKKAFALLKRARLDLVVANTNRNQCYAAYLIDDKKEYGKFSSKETMTKELIKLLVTRHYLTSY